MAIPGLFAENNFIETRKPNVRVQRAAEVLRGGELVAFPTETVYGLGADATQSAAVEKIFAAKGRPATNPLIVHVAGIETARKFAADWPASAEKLAARFWPGPLTVVVPKSAEIVDEATAGLASVGLRMPNHPLALELLREFGGPIAAPSANRSNRVSPTTAAHVQADLGERVELILDGGPCRVGIESTVLDLSVAPPRLLRPGAVAREAIEAVIGPIEVGAPSAKAGVAAKSPGMQALHYAPVSPCFHFATEQTPQVLRAIERSGERIILLARSELRLKSGADWAPGRAATILKMPDNPETYARECYARLREADDAGPSAILIEMPPARPEWSAVSDRLSRAARPVEAWPGLRG